MLKVTSYAKARYQAALDAAKSQRSFEDHGYGAFYPCTFEAGVRPIGGRKSGRAGRWAAMRPWPRAFLSNHLPCDSCRPQSTASFRPSPEGLRLWSLFSIYCAVTGLRLTRLFLQFVAAKYYRLAEQNGNKTLGNTW
jgi:hypothetical protein